MPEEISGAEEFEAKVLKSDKPVLVDFWAPWCGPCRMVAPIVEEIGKENEEKMTVVKVDVDKNGEVAAKYEIQSIPTLILFKDGEAVEKILGAVPKDEIDSKVAPHL